MLVASNGEGFRNLYDVYGHFAYVRVWYSIQSYALYSRGRFVKSEGRLGLCLLPYLEYYCIQRPATHETRLLRGTERGPSDTMFDLWRSLLTYSPRIDSRLQILPLRALSRTR